MVEGSATMAWNAFLSYSRQHYGIAESFCLDDESSQHWTELGHVLGVIFHSYRAP
jgi:hypothetical protein